MIRETQIKLLECLHYMWDTRTDEMSEIDQRSLDKLINTCMMIVANFDDDKFEKCPNCGSDDFFKFELTHSKCRKCRSRFTN